MGKVLKLHTVNSDGTEPTTEPTIAYLVIDPNTSKPFENAEGDPSVVIQLRPVSQAKYRQVEAEYTQRRLNKKTRAMEEVTDWAAVQDATIAYCVKSWVGIMGADDKPLECVLDAKLALPGDLKNELIQCAMQGEAVETTAASFRAA